MFGLVVLKIEIVVFRRGAVGKEIFCQADIQPLVGVVRAKVQLAELPVDGIAALDVGIPSIVFVIQL